MPDPTDTPDFFRPRLAEMIDLRHPLTVLASRLPWPHWRLTLHAEIVQGACRNMTTFSVHPFRWQEQVLPQRAARACPFASWPACCI